jgi:hypothetical protein
LGLKTLSEFTKSNLKVQEDVCVPIITLDNFFKKSDLHANMILLKTDTQGFEMEVFKGAKKILKYVDTIIVEVDFVGAYKNQCDFLDILNFLARYNFKVNGFFYPPGIDSRGNILGADVILTKASNFS